MESLYNRYNCSMCYKNFADTDSQAVVFPCGHFCCLKETLHLRNCPQCNKVLPMTEDFQLCNEVKYWAISVKQLLISEQERKLLSSATIHQQEAIEPLVENNSTEHHSNVASDLKPHITNVAVAVHAVEERYEGSFLHGTSLRHGSGILHYADGSIYCGQFKNNAAHGEGTLTTEWTSYVGRFQNNLFHGAGRLVDRQQQFTYEGEFESGLKHGRGFYSSSDNQYTYGGDFQHDRATGFATITQRNRFTYIGEVKDGCKHGKGAITFVNGSSAGVNSSSSTGSSRGNFQNNSIGSGGNSAVASYCNVVTCYSGEFQRDVRDGWGTEELRNGDIFVGHFKNDRRHGWGTYTRKELGVAIEMEWKYNRPAVWKGAK